MPCFEGMTSTGLPTTLSSLRRLSAAMVVTGPKSMSALEFGVGGSRLILAARLRPAFAETVRLSGSTVFPAKNGIEKSSNGNCPAPPQ